MHLAFFSDQHPATLGGLQTSLGVQRKHLERRGHTVTVCAPKSTHTPSPEYARSQDVLLSAVQIGEHSLSMAGARFDAEIDRGFARRPEVDCVHVQADVWGAWNGYRFAARHGLPLVHTMHTDVAVGLPAIVPWSEAVFALLFAAQRRFLGTARIRDVAEYTRAFAERADVLIAPSTHFAERLRQYGIRQDIHVLPTGVDDDLLSDHPTPRVRHQRPVLLWPGRVSREKGITDFLLAFARSGVDAEIHVYGTGNDLSRSRRVVRSAGLGSRVSFRGTVSHRAVLEAMHHADGVVQSSLGYETQGLTLYEAAAVGTAVVLRDGSLGRDLPVEIRFAAATPSIDDFAQAIRDWARQTELRAAAPPSLPGFGQRHRTREAEALYQLAIDRYVARSGDHPGEHRRVA